MVHTKWRDSLRQNASSMQVWYQIHNRLQEINNSTVLDSGYFSTLVKSRLLVRIQPALRSGSSIGRARSVIQGSPRIAVAASDIAFPLLLQWPYRLSEGHQTFNLSSGVRLPVGSPNLQLI